jgi:hypothetical protein
MKPNEEWRLAQERGAGTAKRPAARSARYKPRTKRLEIALTNGISLLVPIAYIEGLRHAAPADLREIQIVGRGTALVFPALDEVVSVHGLIDGVFGSKAWAARIVEPGRAAPKAVSSGSAATRGRSRRASS